jgi:manganese oxidase
MTTTALTPPDQAGSSPADPGIHHDHSGHSGAGRPSEHSGHSGAMGSAVTRPELAVVTILTVLALALGVAIPASQVNLTLSGHDVGVSSCPRE